MISEVKRSIKREVFADLPPRVIIHDILPYHQFKLSEDTTLCELFGYFKLDRFRNLWFYSQSIKIEYFTESFVSIDRLQNLTIKDPSDSLLDIISNQGRNFRCLNSLSLVSSDFSNYNYVDITGFHVELFSRSDSYPALKSFSFCENIDYEDYQSFDMDCFGHYGNKWDEQSPKLWTNLESFSISSPYNFSNGKLLEIMKNLKKLNLSRVNLVEELRIFLPKLERVELNEIRNLIIEPGDNLRSLECCHCVYSVDHKLRTIISILVNKSEKLESLSIIYNDDDDELEEEDMSWMFKGKKNKFKKLKKLDLWNVHFSSRMKKDCFKSLENLSIWTGTCGSKIVYSTTGENLKKLKIQHAECQDLENTKFTNNCPKWPNLEILVVNGIVNGGNFISDNFFRYQGFLKLRSLTIISKTIRGYDWGSFSSAVKAY